METQGLSCLWKERFSTVDLLCHFHWSTHNMRIKMGTNSYTHNLPHINFSLPNQTLVTLTHKTVPKITMRSYT